MTKFIEKSNKVPIKGREKTKLKMEKHVREKMESDLKPISHINNLTEEYLNSLFERAKKWYQEFSFPLKGLLRFKMKNNDDPVGRYFRYLVAMYCCDSKDIAEILGSETKIVDEFKEILFQMCSDADKKYVELHDKDLFGYFDRKVAQFEYDCVEAYTSGFRSREFSVNEDFADNNSEDPDFIVFDSSWINSTEYMKGAYLGTQKLARYFYKKSD